ncbi:MAG: TetR/AcrR family transcriptional regulator [Firmicutes bacterium]|nr:TetR/AcrR family transcriptional regulator [Bacillota bacterium]
MNGFEKRREEKKKIIREAALKLFLENGTDRVTIKQIAEEASVSHVSIYNFYGSKGELINELALSLISDMKKQYEEICSGNHSFEEKLKGILDFKMEMIENRYWELVQIIAKTNSTVKKAFDDMILSGKEWFLALVEEGKRLGIIQSDINNHAVFMLMDIFTSYFMNNESAKIALSYNPKLAEDLQHIFWHGLLK